MTQYISDHWLHGLVTASNCQIAHGLLRLMSTVRLITVTGCTHGHRDQWDMPIGMRLAAILYSYTTMHRYIHCENIHCRYIQSAICLAELVPIYLHGYSTGNSVATDIIHHFCIKRCDNSQLIAIYRPGCFSPLLLFVPLALTGVAWWLTLRPRDELFSTPHGTLLLSGALTCQTSRVDWIIYLRNKFSFVALVGGRVTESYLFGCRRTIIFNPVDYVTLQIVNFTLESLGCIWQSGSLLLYGTQH